MVRTGAPYVTPLQRSEAARIASHGPTPSKKSAVRGSAPFFSKLHSRHGISSDQRLLRASPVSRSSYDDHMKRINIVATIGPATQHPTMLRRLADAGMDVVRLNGSHADLKWHAETIATVRQTLPDIPILL